MGRAQSLITTDPLFPTINDSITITYDASQGNRGALNQSPLYVHCGLVIAGPTSSAWTNVPVQWATANPRFQMTSIGNNRWRFGFRIPRLFNVSSNLTVYRIGFVFRNATGTAVGRNSDGSDIFVPIFQQNQFALAFTSPVNRPGLGRIGQVVPIRASLSQPGNATLFVNGQSVLSQSNVASIQYDLSLTTSGQTRIRLEASNGATIIRDSFYLFVRPQTQVADLPAGLKDGINYHNATEATLVLFAPGKDDVFVLGDWNNWERSIAGFMNKTPDGNRFWVRVSGLQPGRNYAYQYLVDSTIRIADPYSEVILDPDDDRFIPASTYPGIPAVPVQAQGRNCSVLQTNAPQYNWRNTSFSLPSKSDLVVYELHIRDFVRNRNYATLIDSLKYLKRLGVNCIELMPINEFEGNNSWGYNPSHHYAIDKYYGTPNMFRAFVDSCHSMGIAVVVDVVFNHAFGQSPLAQLWWDAANNRPDPSSPFLNPVARHPLNVGYDFNHESQATQAYMDRCLRHLLEDYKVDGFRFDLSKGFTQTFSGDDLGLWGRYDASRIRLLKRMYDQVRTYSQNSYLILEHFADNSEETELSNYGFMFWGNLNNPYLQSAMGFNDQSSIAWGFYRNRGWSQPNVLTYMESHDEERMMVKNRQFGNMAGAYNVRVPGTALDRCKLAAAFFFTVPGPKMIWQFGELGYDFSINYCTNGTINPDCRTGEKPIRWDYLTQPDRKNLFETYAALIRLKKEEPVFEANNMDLLEQNLLKRIRLDNAGTQVIVIGNFGVTANPINPQFHRTGKWFDFFSGDSINVTSVSAGIPLAAGEFRIYSTKRFFTPSPNLLISSTSERIGSGIKIGYPYPNPTSNGFGLEIELDSPQEIDFILTDLAGKTIFESSQKAENQGHNVLNFGQEFTALPRGTYILKVQTQSGQASRVIIKS